MTTNGSRKAWAAMAAGLAIAATASGIGAGDTAHADGRSRTAPLFPASPAAPTPPAAPATTTPTGAAAPTMPAARSGALDFANGAVRLVVPANWAFFDAAEARAYLARVGQPVPAGDILGLLAPQGLAPTQPEFWGSVVSWNPIGPVSEDSAGALSGPEVLAAAKAARGAFRPLESFQVAPAYDAEGDTLAWAEKFAVPTGADPDATKSVTVEQRALGREGVLAMTTPLTPDSQAGLKARLDQMLGMATFPAGKRLADATAADKPSEFDLAGLITGQKRIGAVAETASSEGPAATASAPTAPAAPGGWFQWLAMALVGLSAMPWLLYGRVRQAEDPNLAPR